MCCLRFCLFRVDASLVEASFVVCVICFFPSFVASWGRVRGLRPLQPLRLRTHPQYFRSMRHIHEDVLRGRKGGVGGGSGGLPGGGGGDSVIPRRRTVTYVYRSGQQGSSGLEECT